MTMLSKITFAALGGMTVLILAGQADAAIDRRKFQASPNEIRRYCQRIDLDFWWAKRTYGCGDKIGCIDGHCHVYSPPPPPPPPHYPPALTHGGDGRDGGNKTAGDNGGDGGGGGKGGTSAAGGSGPN